jgi:hypothetical protein
MYSQKEVNRVFGHIPVKTLRWWGQMGLYGWVSETSDGRGIHREYELSNLYQIGVVEQLASLNIPSLVISMMIMKKHFRSGMRMSAPINADQPEKVDANEWPLVNVAEQMNKILVITKVLSGTVSQPGKRERPSYGWGSFLIEGPEEMLAVLSGRSHAETMILIDLAMIKKSVDLLINLA